jgi:hypothetical protein
MKIKGLVASLAVVISIVMGGAAFADSDLFCLIVDQASDSTPNAKLGIQVTQNDEGSMTAYFRNVELLNDRVVEASAPLAAVQVTERRTCGQGKLFSADGFSLIVFGDSLEGDIQTTLLGSPVSGAVHKAESGLFDNYFCSQPINL